MFENRRKKIAAKLSKEEAKKYIKICEEYDKKDEKTSKTIWNIVKSCMGVLMVWAAINTFKLVPAEQSAAVITLMLFFLGFFYILG